jgi:hypothetical protein
MAFPLLAQCAPPSEDARMDEPIAYTLHRIPGLFRRWELAALMKPGEDYHIEDAGRASDGTPLVAVYSSSPPSLPEDRT